ncbi:ankyrin repeat-containing protein [Acanthamoeba castellanii str. Neff]|uniref:Ankyrin repeat-containing protein n=1 Tax=Acanthamoeba castellanii (strain ATCC 30010 / Neff) TaxID=1257118 RepID=L8H7A9_ACACF|nr:ankyrin repeat-containing protein [Acanthamoeba castellanii str. Neff]ELR21429.1 ankyrin repeat-containing protein [Acanthamoeba castellanii str. Neff]
MDPLEVLPEEVWLHHVLLALFAHDDSASAPSLLGHKAVLACAGVSRNWRRLALDQAQWRTAVWKQWGTDLLPLPASKSPLLWAPPHSQPPTTETQLNSHQDPAGWHEFFWAAHRALRGMSRGAPGWEDCAVRFGLMGAIRDPLDRNSDIDCWASCFFAATRWNRADVFARLVTMCEARGGFALVWRAFSHGVDLQWGDGHQHSLMHEAIRSGSAEILRTLLRYYGDTNRGLLLIWCAQGNAHGKEDLVEMVLEPERNRHAVTHQVCKQGRDALITACLHNDFKLAKLFIQVELWISAGANVNALDTHDATPLHKAAEANNHQLIHTLVKHGAHTDARNKSQRTPLHIAAKRGHSATIRALLDAGAEASVWDARGRRPLDQLAASVHPVTRKLLADRTSAPEAQAPPPTSAAATADGDDDDNGDDESSLNIW